MTERKSSLEVSDAAAAAVQKTEHRVTLQSLKDKVTDVEYYHPALAPHFTIAFVKLSNGFVLSGQSAPADPANFNEQYGKDAAFDDAIRKAWAHEGYLLCEKLAA